MKKKNFTQDNETSHFVQQLLRDEPAFVSSVDFGSFVAQGIGTGPSVLIGDQAEISLIDSVADGRLDHRMALLAKNGDTVLVRKRESEFETYLTECLGLDDVRFLEMQDTSRHPVARQARETDRVLQLLADAARVHGGLTLKAYLTTGSVWRLAQAIGTLSGQVIHVCGPSPRVTRRANNKLWFAQIAREIIGLDAIPPTLSAYGPTAAAGLVCRIIQDADQVIVKVPDSAGSAGNVRLESRQLDGMAVTDIRQLLLSRLRALGWQDSYPILVGVWDKDVTRSPSAQLWLPKESDGPPVVEGIFEQHVQGDTAVFAGAARSDLPEATQARLRGQAIRIARVFQHLGYYGRCSFDAVICSSPGQPETLHWIECNGRWGGVSIPMTAAGQLLENGANGAISIVQETVQARPMHTAALRKRLADLMFQKGGADSGLIIMSPPESAQGVSVNLLSIAGSQKEADNMLAKAMRRVGSV